MEEERKKMWKELMGEKSKTSEDTVSKTAVVDKDEWLPLDVTCELFVEPTQEDLEKAKKKRKVKKKRGKEKYG
jgi:hypothetical protein